MRPQAFVVCATEDIAQGQAKPFNLARVDDGGGARPFPIVVVRTRADSYIGYRNQCPHEGVWLNIGSGGFLTADGANLRCGRHGAAFEIESGLCLSGPCAGESLHPLALVVIGGDVCLLGERVAEDVGEDDETMEIMIHPD